MSCGSCRLSFTSYLVNEVPSPGALEMQWIQENFWVYMGILLLVLVGLVAVLFVVRKNQDN